MFCAATPFSSDRPPQKEDLPEKLYRQTKCAFGSWIKALTGVKLMPEPVKAAALRPVAGY